MLYALLTRGGQYLAEGDEVLVFTTHALAVFARKRRGYDDRAGERYCRIARVRLIAAEDDSS